MPRRKATDTDDTMYTEEQTVEAVPNEDGEGHWVEPEPITAGVHKRHSFKGGDTCVVCGATRKTRAQAPRAPRAAKVGNVETLAALLWAAIGVGVEHQPLIGRAPTKRVINGQEVEGAPLAVAVGRALQMESAVAGRRIDRALRANPIAYAVISLFLSHPAAKWVTELAPLMIPPIVVIAAAKMPPEVIERFRPAIMSLMIPIVVEQAKMIEDQAALMAKMEGMTAENIAIASQMVDSLFGYNGNAGTPPSGE